MRIADVAVVGCAVAVAAGLAAGGGTAAREVQPAARIDFQKQIEPVLSRACSECHSQDRRKGGLSLATYSDVLEGGRSGAAVRPGNSAGSLLIHRITGEIEPQMPKDELQLDASEIALVRLWIDQGARATPTSAPAPAPWEAPLALDMPAPPAVRWPAWSTPVDRLVASYLAARRVPEPTLVGDARFARRVYLDVWGLLPTPEELQAFGADRSPSKRRTLVDTLLADNQRYAEHWMSFWNDLLRNEDGVTYFSETAGRKSITDWLYGALVSNQPYDRVVTQLLDPKSPSDPDGFLTGVNWRGETSAAVTPWMQASQNTAQIFLGVNLKCNACHDSFVSKWKLKDAYALAGFFAPEPRLRLYRCDVAQDEYTGPGFLYPELNREPPSGSLADRRATAAAIFTDSRNGRLARTVVNRLWHRLFGRGIVSNPDEMDGKPWSPELLDWIAADFVAHGYDLKHLLRTMLTSRAYQMPAVARSAEPPARGYVFDGPEVRRMTAEQFSDAIGAITGEWSVYQPRGAGGGVRRDPTASDPATTGAYGREWRAASSNLTRALGRPIRDQVISSRATQSTTPQALELVNGEILTRWLSRGARRMIGELPQEPLSLYNRAVAGRNASSSNFDIDISSVSRLWLIVQDFGSNAPERVEPLWAQGELVGPSGAVPLSSLQPIDSSGLRRTAGSAQAAGALEGVRVTNPSRLVYDISGRNFTRFRGSIAIDNPRSEIGSTLNPQVRFYVFSAEPQTDRLLPPAPDTPLPPPPALASAGEVVDRVFRHALGRAPSSSERTLAIASLTSPDAAGRAVADLSRRSGEAAKAEGLADLLWVLLMKPEFQLIY
jgi:Protein of unknown function (DUF1549)/Protein of unknown function (DUF1553)/Planctomycete cytochrome C